MSMNDFWNQMANAKGGRNRLPKIKPGKHRLAIANYKSDNTSKGAIIECEFVVLASTSHAVGETVGIVWFVGQPSAYPDTHYEQAKARDFMMELLKQPDPVAAVNTIKSVLASPNNDLRGVQIDCVAMLGVSKQGKQFTAHNWYNVQQDGTVVAETRKRIDAGIPLGQAPAGSQEQPAFTPPSAPAQPAPVQFGGPAPAQQPAQTLPAFGGPAPTQQAAPAAPQTPSVLGNLFGQR